jgi:hypothetical protein
MNEPSLPREVSYEWSPDLVKLGARRYIIRRTGRRMFLFLGVVAVLSAILAMRGENLWWCPAILSVIPPLLWLVYYLQVTRIRYEMPDQRVKVRIESESITFETSEQNTTLKWSAIKQLWIFPDVMLVFTYTKQNYTAIPVAPFGEESRRYLETKVRENGGEIC